MKKFITILFSALCLCACGTGSYTVVSGGSDEAELSVSATNSYAVTVVVDGASYQMVTVKEKLYRKDRNARATANNTIYLTPGKHTVKVLDGTDELFSQQIFVSAGEHRVINLKNK